MRFAGLALALIALSVASPVASGAGPSPSVPCQKHEGAAKKACIKQIKRDRMPYPPRPVTWGDFQKRATGYEYATLHRIAVCEMGPGPKVKGSPWLVRWGTVLPRYSSAFGIWNGNFATTKAITGYDWPTDVPAEEAFHALALARKYGFSAWGCF